MFFPIFDYDDGYGFTYGGQTAVVDAFGKGTRVSVPLSWGGTRRAAIEADRTFKSGPLTRLTGSFGIAQRENPYYEIDDRRTELERARGAAAVQGGHARRRYHQDGADLRAVARRLLVARRRRHAGHAWQHVVSRGRGLRQRPRGAGSIRSAARLSRADSIDRYRFDARGFKRLFGQNVIALRAEYDTASAPLPHYEQWLLGGSSLRGVPVRHARRRSAAARSAELRVPFSSPLERRPHRLQRLLGRRRTAAHGERIARRNRATRAPAPACS